jgi:hypothetical protein
MLWNLAIYQSYLENRYIRRVIYNDSGKSDTVSGWGKVRIGVQKALLFLL